MRLTFLDSVVAEGGIASVGPGLTAVSRPWMGWFGGRQSRGGYRSSRPAHNRGGSQGSRTPRPGRACSTRCAPRRRDQRRVTGRRVVGDQVPPAQYRAGRQGDALRTILRLRSVLARERGFDPSPDIDVLEQAILREDSLWHGPETGLSWGHRVVFPQVKRGRCQRRSNYDPAVPGQVLSRFGRALTSQARDWAHLRSALECLHPWEHSSARSCRVRQLSAGDARRLSEVLGTSEPWCRSWCEILGIEEEIRVCRGETCTRIRW